MNRCTLYRQFHRQYLSGLLVWLLLAWPVAVGAQEPLEVVVRGVENDLLLNVQAVLAPPPGLVREGMVDRLWLERFRRQAPQIARRALEPFGYYAAQVSARLEVLERDRYRLVVDVDPGRPVRLEMVRVELQGPGARQEVLRERVGDFPLRRGHVLRHDLYEEGKGSLQARAVDLGYLDADFVTHEVRVFLAEHRAEIELVLETGPRYYFGEVEMVGAEEYPESFLRRHLAFRFGETFSFPLLGQTQVNFLDSDRFRDVIITPRQDLAEDHHVPIHIRLTPLAPKRLRPGIGYATDTGARFTARYQDVNVWGLGHEFDNELTIAQQRQTFGSAYIIPSTRNVESQTALRGALQEDDLLDTRTILTEIERIRAFPRGRRGSVFLRLQQDDFTQEGRDITARVVLPGVRFSQRRGVAAARPTQGYRYVLELRGTHEAIGSDTSLLQFLAGGNGLVDLPGRFSLLLRAQTGVTLQADPLQEVPPTLRFFAGGDQSIRGYAFQSVGTRDSTGEVVGGRHLLVGSIELERAVGESWGVAGFYDVGDAYNNLEDVEWRQAAGLGVRYYTIVGPIKIDVARQIGVANPSYRLHITVGLGW